MILTFGGVVIQIVKAVLSMTLIRAIEIGARDKKGSRWKDSCLNVILSKSVFGHRQGP